MKKLILAFALLAIGSPLWAQQAGQFGGGLLLGDPIGGTAKYWIDGTKAFDFGLGERDSEMAVYADFVWHNWDILPQPAKGKLGPYLAVGPQIVTYDNAQFGLRTMVGLSYWIPDHPIELFAEAGPLFILNNDQGISADGGVGVRFYIGDTAGGKK
jgi:hypothetical protein